MKDNKQILRFDVELTEPEWAKFEAILESCYRSRKNFAEATKLWCNKMKNEIKMGDYITKRFFHPLTVEITLKTLLISLGVSLLLFGIGVFAILKAVGADL